MRKFNVNVDGKTYQVEIEEVGAVNSAPAIAAPAAVKSVAAPVAVKSVAAPVAAPVAPVVAGSGTPVKCPMPGTIISFKVADGASVKRGTPIVVLEAMKMENDIVAPCDGVVTISVAKGATVNSGDILAYVG